MQYEQDSINQILGGKRLPLFSLLLLFSFSCQKEEPQVNFLAANNEGITFHDGRLIFKDDTTFVNHLRWLFENQDNEKIISEKNGSLGFKSMTEYFNEGIKIDETDPKFSEYVNKYPNVFSKHSYANSTLYLLPHSRILCYVSNKDGFYQVGDKICRIAGKYIYKITDGDESKIELLFLPKEQIHDKSISIIPSISEAKNDYRTTSCLFPGHTYRIVGILRETNDGDLWYNEVITIPQHKVLGVWFGADLSTKTANDDGAYYINGNGPFAIDGHYNSASGQTTRQILLGYYQIDMSLSYAAAYNRGRLDNNYVYIYWPDALDPSATWTYPTWTPTTEPFQQN